MANVFKQATEPNNKVDTSHFDLSFQNNLTMQFGYLYPCFVKKFAPKTSVKIKPTFGLNFMPMMFPVQTRMRARMSFYKVRCRSLWKDYKDWFGNLKPNLEKPYIDFNSEDKLKYMASTGSLGDYLGLPTVHTPEYSSYQNIELSSSGDYPVLNQSASAHPSSLEALRLKDFYQYIKPGETTIVSERSYVSNSERRSVLIFTSPNADSLKDGFMRIKASLHFGSLVKSQSALSSLSALWNYYVSNNKKEQFPLSRLFSLVAFNDLTADGADIVYKSPIAMSNFNYDGGVFSFEADVSLGFLGEPQNYTTLALMVPNSIYLAKNLTSDYNIYYGDNEDYSSLFPDSKYDFFSFLSTHPSSAAAATSYLKKSNVFSIDSWFYYSVSNLESEIKDITLATSPYYNSGSSSRLDQLKIDASFFRAYESIYNAYFRDIRNNPFMLNGQPEYNTFIPTDDGGADDNIYKLRRRNWEADFLTTAVPSPQQGRAPLVGITTYNDTTNLAFTAEDGKKYAVTFDYDKDAGELKDVAFRELGDDAIVREARNMMDLVSSGISISDLRNVNAYTKFLELNMRKGYFYKDLVEGHFDTKVRYDELNMPEFIGGTAKDVFVNPVSQTVQTSQDGSYFGALGSYAGQASVSGQADNTISAYFDEETIVIGLISIVPVANYSQLLPKHFLHRELLDSYFPEFDNIGFQPIFYNEVCPIQAYNDNPKTLSETFGYQRPWYDYVASTDEVHGLFRTNLRNFLINRVFASKPTLSEDFLLVDPEQINDVFSVTQTTDKILGQIWFDVDVKAPISRIAIPRLD